MSKLTRVRAVPWILVVQAALAANGRWKQLPAGDRDRLTQLLKQSKGLPTNLSTKEREEVRLLLGRLELAGLARELAPFAFRASRRRRRGR